MPVSAEKTFWSEEVMIFLGFLLDGRNHMVMVPVDKIAKANNLIKEALNAKKNKVTILKLQQICGFLNFLCRCVVPGCAFTRRLYNFIPTNLKSHHHVKVNTEIKLNLYMWQQFLANPTVFSRPFTDFGVVFDAIDLDLFTNSSHNFSLGCGGIFGNKWFFIGWDSFTALVNPSIKYLELFAVTVAVALWAKEWKIKKIFLFCDNESAVHMINSASSSCRNCMVLIRIITLQGLIHNVRIMAKHVFSRNNPKADALSRRKFNLFKSLAPYAKDTPEEIPCELWPLSKIWIQ